MKRFLSENADLFAEIDGQVRAAVGIGAPKAAAEEREAPQAATPK